MTTAPPAAAPARRPRRLILPLALLLLALLAAGAAYVRGTWADSAPRDPTSVAEGPVSQLYQPPGQGKQVRAAVLLPYPRRRVWEAVTDYARYADFLPYLAGIEATPTDGGCHMTGQAKSALRGYWPFTVDIHEDRTGQTWRAWWDETGEQVRVNRGAWALTARGPEETLLVLTLEAEVAGYPNFVLRNVFLHRLKQVLRAVDRRLAEEGR